MVIMGSMEKNVGFMLVFIISICVSVILENTSLTFLDSLSF